MLIWTTIPWTPPANLADRVSSVLRIRSGQETNGDVFSLAKELAEPVLQKPGFPATTSSTPVPGEAPSGWKARHPFIERDSVFILGEHVTPRPGHRM